MGCNLNIMVINFVMHVFIKTKTLSNLRIKELWLNLEVVWKREKRNFILAKLGCK